ncbi:hypothetical protein AWENTII_005489 [Aspergillus wentii]
MWTAQRVVRKKEKKNLFKDEHRKYFPVVSHVTTARYGLAPRINRAGPPVALQQNEKPQKRISRYEAHLIVFFFSFFFFSPFLSFLPRPFQFVASPVSLNSLCGFRSRTTWREEAILIFSLDP